MSETFKIALDPTNPKIALGCIDLVESPDDGGWYAHEFYFKRSETRTSYKIYTTRGDLVQALQVGKHRWGKWGCSDDRSTPVAAAPTTIL